MGQLGFARVLGEELRSSGIRVTTLTCGAVDTPIWDGRPGFDRSRMLHPDDIAGLVISVLRRPNMAIDEIVAGPPDGAL
jgi:short-subunit dehydrogenase